MNIIDNWNFLNKRMQEASSPLVPSLFEIHMGAFDDLRRSGDRLSINGQSVATLAASLEPFERLSLAGTIGQNLIEIDMSAFGLYQKKYNLKQADYFPNCIFIAIAAMLENLDGAFTDVKKVNVLCEYETIAENEDPIGKKLPILQECFPWIDLEIHTIDANPEPQPKPRYISRESTKAVFGVQELAKIDLQRTAFTGDVLKGRIKVGECVNVVDETGRVLCPEGPVLKMWTDGKSIEEANEKQHVDELLVAVEIPKGTYKGMFLMDGDKELASQDNVMTDEVNSSLENQQKEDEDVGKKKGILGGLFRKKN